MVYSKHIYCNLFIVEVIQGGKYSTKRSVNLLKDLTQVEKACGVLQQKLQLVLEYVEDVLVRYLFL